MTPSTTDKTADLGEIVAELRELLEKATPGWRANSVNPLSVVSEQSHPIWTLSDPYHRQLHTARGPRTGEDRELLLGMYEALPTLLDALAAERAKTEALESLNETLCEVWQQNGEKGLSLLAERDTLKAKAEVLEKERDALKAALNRVREIGRDQLAEAIYGGPQWRAGDPEVRKDAVRVHQLIRAAISRTQAEGEGS